MQHRSMITAHNDAMHGCRTWSTYTRHTWWTNKQTFKSHFRKEFWLTLSLLYLLPSHLWNYCIISGSIKCSRSQKLNQGNI